MEFAVRKKDFRIIRERMRGDPSVPFDWGPGEPLPPGFDPDAPEPVAPSALAFTTPSLSVPVGACAGPIGVETRAPPGTRQAVTEPATLDLAAAPPSGVFFSDAKCTTAVTRVELGVGASSAEVYLRAVQVGALQITVSAPELTAASQTHTVTPARAVALAFTTPPQTVAGGTCSSAVTVQARDAFNNPASVGIETAVQLLTIPAKGITFYSRPDCTGAAITRASIPANHNSVSFYFKGRRPRTVSIAAILGTVSVSQDAIITSTRPARSRPGSSSRHGSHY